MEGYTDEQESQGFYSLLMGRQYEEITLVATNSDPNVRQREMDVDLSEKTNLMSPFEWADDPLTISAIEMPVYLIWHYKIAYP